jgi:hypothetical protein
MLGHKIRMLAKLVACSFDLHHHGMMQEAVGQRGGDHRIAEHLALLRKASVRGQDHRALRVARIDELEEQIASTGYDRQVPDLVHGQE